ncbi:MAG: hypothetical protein IPG50_15670 [Myxococcales bacterium]|nr:hypothetical protein [Myxococcales bacterium]
MRPFSLLQSFRTSWVPLAAFVASAALATGCASSKEESSDQAALQTSRPPQFVVMGFDGSLNLAFWEESLAFAKTTTASGKPLAFTYFISGVYFIPDAKKARYTAPHGLGVGKSAIGWGGDEAKIQSRVDWVDRAANEGHEIASHANGHFDGSAWTHDDWKSEFDQFDSIFFGAKAVKKLSAVRLEDIGGFRAPQLGHSTGLFQVLGERRYAYDTSKTAEASYWPQKLGNVWNFPLAQLRIVGSGKKTLSMDYNFYFADSRGVADAANSGVYRKQMIDTYMAYFKGNYYGNRAPLHIGHHFSKWNGGAYWAAMQDFAKEVCGKPEVKCVTYKELVKYLEGLTAEQRADYRAGAFPKLARPTNGDSERDVPEGFFEEPSEGEFVGDRDEAHEIEEESAAP